MLAKLLAGIAERPTSVPASPWQILPCSLTDQCYHRGTGPDHKQSDNTVIAVSYGDTDQKHFYRSPVVSTTITLAKVLKC